jgi:hypothetical protein
MGAAVDPDDRKTIPAVIEGGPGQIKGRAIDIAAQGSPTQAEKGKEKRFFAHFREKGTVRGAPLGATES